GKVQRAGGPIQYDKPDPGQGIDRTQPDPGGNKRQHVHRALVPAVNLVRCRGRFNTETQRAQRHTERKVARLRRANIILCGLCVLCASVLKSSLLQFAPAFSSARMSTSSGSSISKQLPLGIQPPLWATATMPAWLALCRLPLPTYHGPHIMSVLTLRTAR